MGAGAVVTHDVAAFATVYGNPARIHGFTCWCGLQLPLSAERAAGEPAVVVCTHCARRYRRAAAGLAPADG